MDKATDKKTNGPALRIRSVPERFRRAGRAFGREASEIPLSELSDEEIKILKAEPMLVVELSQDGDGPREPGKDKATDADAKAAPAPAPKPGRAKKANKPADNGAVNGD
jgi:hypothetical protein